MCFWFKTIWEKQKIKRKRNERFVVQRHSTPLWPIYCKWSDNLWTATHTSIWHKHLRNDPKCIVVIVVGEYQKPNHTISKNIKTLIISRAEKISFFFFKFLVWNMQSAALQARNSIMDPLVKTPKIKKSVLVSNAYEHCKWLASPVELIYFYNAWQELQSKTSKKSRSLCGRGSRSFISRAGWFLLLKPGRKSVKHVVIKLAPLS